MCLDKKRVLIILTGRQHLLYTNIRTKLHKIKADARHDKVKNIGQSSIFYHTGKQNSQVDYQILFPAGNLKSIHQRSHCTCQFCILWLTFFFSRSIILVPIQRLFAIFRRLIPYYMAFNNTSHIINHQSKIHVPSITLCQHCLGHQLLEHVNLNIMGIIRRWCQPEKAH